MPKWTTTSYVDYCIEKFGPDLYDYSDTVYTDSKCKVIVRCIEHNIKFTQDQYSHRTGRAGCSDCLVKKIEKGNSTRTNNKPEPGRIVNISSKITTERFIDDCRAKLGDLYDYSDTKYVTSKLKVTIKCNLHDISFKQTPAGHKVGRAGCPKCIQEKSVRSNTLLKDTHADIFDKIVLDHVDHKSIDINNIKTGSHEKLQWQCAVNDDHMWHAQVKQRVRGEGCPYCSNNKLSDETSLMFKYQDISNEWSDKNEYTPNDYSAYSHAKVWWKCSKGHDDYESTIANRTHTNKQGCPRCANVGYSGAALDWLKHIADKENIHIQHASNGGEHVVKLEGRKFYLDGYCAETQTGYEFYGDYWHGNPDIFDHDKINPTIGKTYRELYDNTMKRERFLEENDIMIISIWENDWNQLKKNIADD